MSPVCAEGGGMECKGDRRAGHPKPRLCYGKGMEREWKGATDIDHC